MSTANKFTIVILLLGAAATTLTGCSTRQEASTNTNSAHEAAVAPVEVATTQVVERAMRRSIEVVGSFDAQDEVTLSCKASGEMAEVNVDVGSQVRKGQVIARLDSRELTLHVEQAQAALAQAVARLEMRTGEKFDADKQPDVRQAKAALERARYDWQAAQDLVNHGDISRQQYDVAQRGFEQAEARYQAALDAIRGLQAVIEERRASLDLAKKQLGDAVIVSPIDGVVKEKRQSRGEYVKPGDPIAIILQVNPLRLRLEVPEAFAASVKPGQVVSLKVDSYPDREFQGTVKRINPALDEKNRSLTAEAEVNNRAGQLKPGMFARAQVVSDPSSTALLVPENSVVSVAGVNKVFVVDGGHAVERLVKLGTHDGNLVEIIEGVRTGERVITTNTDKLENGAPVSTSNS
ncbi:MAG TPA: efflux RND transporter periplasmic adaptor subunit [Blastocatellia bacterium]|nr:efflux RND transporter periplasmic adaptor subunit [Blastocatellia bacterium]